MANKVYIRCVAAAVLAVVAIMTGCDSKQIDNSRTESSSALEIIADSSSKIESSSSLNESSRNENSESSKIEPSSTADSSSNAESSEIADSSSEVEAITPAPVVEEYYEPTYTEPVITQEVVTAQAPVEEVSVEEVSVVAESGYAPYDLYNQGRLYYGDYQYTWYSERVLPGYGLAIDGRHTDEDGFVCDGEGYICVASGSLDKGTVVDTPFGEGKVYDCGCPGNVIDVYVNW